MAHAWQFVRSGGFDQVRLTTGADLIALDELDLKLWVALACPIKGLELDERTMALLDTDKDGRIRPPELIDAAKWSGRMLKNIEDLAKGSDSLPLSAIADQSDEGKQLLATARTVLKSLGKPDAGSLTVADMNAAKSAFDLQPFNGDGVVPAESAGDMAIRQILLDIIVTQGPATDRSGKPGVNAASLEKFAKEIVAYAAWQHEAKTVEVAKLDTAKAHLALTAVKAKIDDYFARVRLAAFDSRSLGALNRDQKEYEPLTSQELSFTVAEVSSFPLSHIAADAPLSLERGINPAWAGKMMSFVDQVVVPLGHDGKQLSEATWISIVSAFGPYEAWQGRKPVTAVEKLGADRIKELSAGAWRASIEALIADDVKEETAAASMTSVEKLVRCHRDLMTVANNMVTFRDFYSRQRPAAFQSGTLFLDTRACELCFRVDDAGRHAMLASLAKTYLVYCDCTRAGQPPMTIAAALTAGDIDNVMVGRNGVFYDRQGRDWDATVTKIIEAPISVQQAFWSPYKKLVRFIDEQVSKRAAASEASSTGTLTTAASEIGSAATAAPATPGSPPAPPAPKKFDLGMIAALGVAVGGISAAIGALLQAFFGLGLWMPLGVIGLILLISGPSMVVAWLKLRQRNIGPLLDANGWAVNAQAKLNIPFGESLTSVRKLPDGAWRDSHDRYAEEASSLTKWLVLGLVVILFASWFVGRLDDWMPKPLKSTTVLGENAPAQKAK